jgi:hypothetical protein
MSIYILSEQLPQLSPSHNHYRFPTISGTKSWPFHNGENLGCGGMWNLFWRTGFNPQLIKINNVRSLPTKAILCVQADHIFNTTTIDALRDWVEKRRPLILSGNDTNLLLALLPDNCRIVSHSPIQPYAAIGYLFSGQKPHCIAPPQWTHLSFTENNLLQSIGKLISIHGERQTPQNALITEIDNSPALIRYKSLVYLNANPFAAYQAWLQGQEDLSPWLQWRHRLFWLDEYAALMINILTESGILSPAITRPGISGLASTTVVLRHDLDASCDTTYLMAEEEAKYSATHATLLDSNAKKWVNLLSSRPNHECAFHFTSVFIPSVGSRALRRVFASRGRSTEKPVLCNLDSNLLHQIKQAIQAGIGISTLHRHQRYLVYPEIIDALDTAFTKNPTIEGSSSFFRSTLLRWGAICPADGAGEIALFPDNQFPSWFPFHLVNAAETGRLVRGWESTSMMELEPQLVDQLLSYHHPQLRQFIFTLNFHPAHVQRPTFYAHGSKASFLEILDLLKYRQIEVRTLDFVYRACTTQSQGLLKA